ncbi:MAG: carbohydrate ABC transporter substrate-binding protein [Oscillospiraceae bacterium]|nr:carbohydrate ABC transporter substrate-binding protein [Oscillospiraceae bacterium]
MKAKKAAALLLSGSMLCGLTACGQHETVVTENKENIVISLSWWGNDVRNEYTIKAAQKFEELNPGITVKCNYSEWSGYQVRSNVQMVSNTEADVMQINYAWIEQYSPDGMGFYDINTLSDHVDLSNFRQSDIDFGMKNGRLNALPIALNTQTVYINKTLYDEYGLDIPKTWDDVFAAAEKMNGEHYPLAVNNKAALFYMVAYAEQTSGKEFIKEDGSLGFGAEEFSIMLEFYKRLIDAGVTPQVEYFERINNDSGMYAGTLAWLSDASSYMGGAEKAGYEVAIADYTSYEGADSLGWYTKPATMYAISANTEYPKESAMLLDFLLNSEEMAELQGVEKGIPISSSARAYLEKSGKLTGLQYAAFEKMNEHSDKMKVISPYMENTDILEFVQESCNAVYYDKMTAEEGGKTLYENVNNVLKKLSE